MLLSCGWLKSPQHVAQEYFSYLYQFQFEKLKGLAKEPALLKASYLQGRVSEMSAEDLAALSSPHITILSVQADKNSAKVMVKISFASGQSIENTALMRRYTYKWYVDDLENPLTNETVYAY